MPKKPVKQGKNNPSTKEIKEKIPTPIAPEIADKKPDTIEPVEQVEKKYRKRVIHDNWAKYEVDLQPDESEDIFNSQETDFSFLASQASSFASHFQMAAEKEWEQKKKIKSDIFKLDLKVLSAGLACVPFHERIGLERSELSDKDLERMDGFAKQSWLGYKSVYDDRKNSRQEVEVNQSDVDEDVGVESRNVYIDTNNSLLDDTPGQRQIAESDISALASANTDPVGKKHELTVDFTESLKKQSVSAEVVPANTTSTTDDNLEDWLDSVLDD